MLILAGEYDYAIAFQERIRIPDDKMDYYKDLAEMYVGDDVSPDFYGWVFPKYDHVAVGAYLSWCPSLGLPQCKPCLQRLGPFSPGGDIVGPLMEFWATDWYCVERCTNSVLL